MKTIAIALIGPDRQPWAGGPVSVRIDHPAMPLSPLIDAIVSTPRLEVLVKPERFAHGEYYRAAATVPGYRTAWTMVGADDLDVPISLLLVPVRAVPSVDAPLSLLNIRAAMQACQVGGRSVWSYVTDVDVIGVDRIFASVDPSLEAGVAASPEWGPASALLHPGFPVSWKCRSYPCGNLQLSFSPDRARVDADIDLARGLGHVGDVIRHRATGRTTDQIEVFRALVQNGIDPGYVLLPEVA